MVAKSPRFLALVLVCFALNTVAASGMRTPGEPKTAGVALLAAHGTARSAGGATGAGNAAVATCPAPAGKVRGYTGAAFLPAAPVDELSDAGDDSVFLDLLQRTAFTFFWNEANPTTGLTRDSSLPNSPCSIASLGFGLTAICIAIDRGWVRRDLGRSRVLAALKTLWTAPQGKAAQGVSGYKGFFYHFLDMNTALRTWNCELSSIDTALLLAGVLYTREYFSGADSLDSMVRNLADAIYLRVDWNWMRNYAPGLMMGYYPETGFINAWWRGYNEAMIMYILALGSPTHPVPSSVWSAWTSGYSWETHYGYSYVAFPPLFGHQYSHCWIDFRDIADPCMRGKGITYFENSRRATLAARAYCIANPKGFVGYGENVWGITACDGPTGYLARGAPPPFNDDGTIAPTAAAGSMPFTPEYSLAALRYMYDNYRTRLWGEYGFRDAFNLTLNWWSSYVIGIDQGPIIVMIENYRSGKVWRVFMQNPYVQQGLARAGFVPFTGVGQEPGGVPRQVRLYQNYPNPCNASTVIRFELPYPTRVKLLVYDALGREVSTLIDEPRAAGQHAVQFVPPGEASGIYLYRLQAAGFSTTKKMVVVK
ncbi:MAG: T9SS type A sorting domain-containing protein [candidate division KSB1 bacterium]|nr:T9SS type A sorting domain-containing protein [candidate division KSB1 bacterium]